jgi:hypothetical protein
MDPQQPATTIAIAYGLNEGPGLAKRLHTALRQSGYIIIDDLQQADIILAHSGGCFILQPRPEQHVVMVGPAYHPGRLFVVAFSMKLALDIRSHYRAGQIDFWIRKTYWNIIYTRKIPTHVRMLRGRARGAFWEHKNVTVVRNIDDPLCTPNFADMPFTTTPQRFVTVPGSHDELWRAPEPIVRVIQDITPPGTKQ